MYRVKVESNFDAAHKLIGYKGKCSRLHGHTWKVEVFATGHRLEEGGILVDFKVLKNELAQILERLDHRFLNDIEEIGNPTAENIARYIFNNLRNLPNMVKLEKVRVWEEPESWVEYYET